MEELIRSDVTLGYDSNILVKDLKFTVNNGDYLCIVGDNGTGKSTLMRSLLGLQQPLGGKIEFCNGLRNTELGYLPQQTIVQKDFPATVMEIVLSGCQSRLGFRPFYNKEEKSIARHNIEKMGITHLTKRCYRTLSGGQQQRVLLARALCATKKLLLLDEPVTGLDPNITEELYSVIDKLNKDDKITIVMISHDIIASVKYASHILHLGTNTFFGTKEEYLASDIGTAVLKLKGGNA